MCKRVLLICVALLCAVSQLGAQQRVQICAHRGFWESEYAAKAQNSIASLKAAQDNGFWGSEFDVHITADDVVVVNHDPDFHRLDIGTSRLSKLRHEGKLKNGEPLPTLQQYLIQGKESPSTMLVLELKKQISRERADKMLDECFRILKEAGLWDPSRVMFISFDYEACKRIAKEAPEFTNQYLEADKDPDTVHKDGINGIDYHFSAFRSHPEWVARAHELGMSVNTWTVDKTGDMQYLIDLGVDCITTNKPLELRALLGDRELRPRRQPSPEEIQAFLARLKPDPAAHTLQPDTLISRQSPYRASKNFGKRIAVFGGSLSVNKESDAAKQIWADMLGAQVVTYGVGGAGFSREQGCTLQRQVDTAGVYDVYVLWASTNDYGNNRECGTWQDYTAFDNYDESKLSTQCGGINYCIKTLLEKNPQAEIYFFTSLRFFGQDAGNNPFSEAPNKTGKSFADYIDAQKACCAYYGIPVLDQFNLQGINQFNVKQFYKEDLTHMNEEGYRRIGPVQAAFLSNGF